MPPLRAAVPPPARLNHPPAVSPAEIIFLFEQDLQYRRSSDYSRALQFILFDHTYTHTHTLQIPQLQSPPFGSVGGTKATAVSHPLPPSHVHPPPPSSHPKASRRLSADQAMSYCRSGFPEPPPMSVVPHLKKLHDYEYIAVLGRGHFGKVS